VPVGQPLVLRKRAWIQSGRRKPFNDARRRLASLGFCAVARYGPCLTAGPIFCLVENDRMQGVAADGVCPFQKKAPRQTKLRSHLSTFRVAGTR
jgi:hypothetical protein